MDHLSSVAKKIFYGPSNWLVKKFSAEQRRAFGFWVIIFATIGTIFFGTSVLWVAILSVIALIPNYTTETPVEEEKE
jgi:hypothetical protein